MRLERKYKHIDVKKCVIIQTKIWWVKVGFLIGENIHTHMIYYRIINKIGIHWERNKDRFKLFKLFLRAQYEGK